MTKRQSLNFSAFWAQKKSDGLVLIDEMLIYRISVLVAYPAYRIGITPNQVTITSCSIGCIAGVFGFFLGTTNVVGSVLILYALAQVAYILDCADGQLARITERTSPFGGFLDHGLDILSFTLTFGGFFAYQYRYFESVGEPLSAQIALLTGFIFLTANNSRYFALESFGSLIKHSSIEERNLDTMGVTLAKCLMDQQVSIFNILIFLVSPALCLAFFGAQAALQLLAYFRYFWRAFKLHRDG
jgi:phosphatidylglycerophosphate synthase